MRSASAATRQEPSWASEVQQQLDTDCIIGMQRATEG